MLTGQAVAGKQILPFMIKESTAKAINLRLIFVLFYFVFQVLKYVFLNVKV